MVQRTAFGSMRRSASVCTTAPSGEDNKMSCPTSNLLMFAGGSPERMFLVFLCGADCENRWASVVEGLHRAHFLGQPEVKTDSATSLLARGVKRRLPGSLPSDFNSDEAAVFSARLRNDVAAYKASNEKQTASDSDSFSLFHAGQRIGTPVHAEQHYQTVTWSNRNTLLARPSHWQCLEESDADVAVDVDCCGDSGSASKLSLRSSGMSAHGSSKPLHCVFSRNACQPLPMLSEQHRSLSRPTLTPAIQQQVHNTQIWVCVQWQLRCCLGISGLNF